MSLTIRPMSREDVNLALGWAAEEGWNPGLHDAECFYEADPDGFFLAEVGGQPAGSVSAVAYDESFGFAGLFIVLPDFRGHRIGVELAHRCLQYLEERNVGIDAVPAKEPQYIRQFGFRPAYRNVRYEGIGVRPQRAAPARVVDLKTTPFEELVAYDREMFPAERPQFLRPWISRPGTTALGILQEDRLVGYGVIRPCRKGFKIGPLFADDATLAEILFERLGATHPGRPIYLDVPDANRAALDLAGRHKMTPVFETARMYSKRPPEIDLNRVFGITTMELG
jgi:GNAT superfamily N-acetyltransferase